MLAVKHCIDYKLVMLPFVFSVTFSDLLKFTVPVV
jgi:hypothetical protein